MQRADFDPSRRLPGLLQQQTSLAHSVGCHLVVADHAIGASLPGMFGAVAFVVETLGPRSGCDEESGETCEPIAPTELVCPLDPNGGGR
jgi:hypothetical protein